MKIFCRSVFSSLAWLLIQFAPHANADESTPIGLLVTAPILAPQVEFTPPAKAWLKQRTYINAAIWGGALPPLHMGFQPELLEGVTADYLNIVQQATGLKVNVRRYATAESAHQALLKGDVDMLAIHDTSSGQENQIAQTRPYLRNRKVLVRRIADPVKSNDDLDRNRLAFVGDEEVAAALKKRYPKATLIGYTNHLNALASLAYGQADVFWTDAITAEFLIRVLYSNSAYIAGDAIEPSANFNFAVSTQQPQLLTILNSVLESIPVSDMRRIIARWGLSDTFVTDEMPLELSAAESTWLAAHPKIKILIGASYAPLTFFDKQDQPQGLAIDLLKTVQRRTGLQLEMVRSGDVNDMVGQLRNHEADLIAAFSVGGLPLKIGQYTRPYAISPFVIVTRQGEKKFAHLEDMKGLRLAVPTGTPLEQWLDQAHPEIIKVSTSNAVRGLVLVAEGEVDGALHTQLGADYFITHHFNSKLSIAAVIGPYPARIAMVAADDQPELKSIIDKVMLEIPPEVLKSMNDRWRNHSAPAVANSWSTYKDEIYFTVGFAFLFALIFVAWNYYLRVQIQKRKQAEKELEDQLEFTRTLIDEVPVALYVRNNEGRLIHCNKAYLDFLQVPLESLLGKTLPDSLATPPPIANEYHRIYLETMEHGRATFNDLSVDLRGMSYRVFHWTLPFRDSNGRVTGIIGGWLDITEREHLAEQLRLAKATADDANQSKSMFLASMSHEIRTPISALIGLIEMLRIRNSSPQQLDENLRVAHESAQSLLSLIGDILDLSKIEAGAMLPVARPTNLLDLLHSIHRLFETNANYKGLEYGIKIDIQHTGVMIDGVMLNQILSNLLSNAIKFTHAGKIKLTLTEVDGESASKASFVLNVTDTGVGLNEAQRKAIFEPFVQVSEQSPTRNGTGLGLSICRRLATLLGATLSVQSQPGEGSRFTLEFEADIVQLEEPQVEMQILNTSGRRLNILIVEDNAPNRFLLRQQLEHLEHRVVACDNGSAAFALWQQAQPAFDLTITDCNMPHMDGYELTRRMREIEQDRGDRPHPVLGLTANAQSSTVDECLAAGMTDCLFKPVKIEALQRFLSSICQTIDRRNEAADDTGGELQKLRILSPEAYPLLVEELVRTNREDSAQLQHLLKTGELPAVARLAHKIKGSAQLTNAQSMMQACADLEEQAQAGDIQQCRKLAVQVTQAIEMLEASLQDDLPARS